MSCFRFRANTLIEPCLPNHEPRIGVSEHRLTIIFPRPVDHITGEVTTEVTPQVTPQVRRLLAVCDGELVREDLQAKVGLSDRKHFRTDYLRPALDAGLIEMTIPERPTSSKQKYRITTKGKAILKELKEELL